MTDIKSGTPKRTNNRGDRIGADAKEAKAAKMRQQGKKVIQERRLKPWMSFDGGLKLAGALNSPPISRQGADATKLHPVPSMQPCTCRPKISTHDRT